MNIQAALERLGVRRLLLAIHDASFPVDADEDIGRGGPATRAAERLYAYVRGLGFTGIQLGPQGQTSRDNPSPYDSTIFSRNLANIALGSLRAGGSLGGLVDDATLDAACAGVEPGPAQHRHAFDAMRAVVDRAYGALLAGARPDLRAQLARFRGDHAAWLVRDGLYEVLRARYAGAGARDWSLEDRALWTDVGAARRAELAAAHDDALARYAFGQLLVALEHERVRATLARHQLAVYGDLQVGYSDGDAWAWGPAFLTDYKMGAPPSRTNPDGQPWGYPVLDPAQHAGRAGELVNARLDKSFAEYDSLRLDHPHGLVCPWVYDARAIDPDEAVRVGARLFESPDLPDFPGLARYAIARADQLDRSVARYDDDWLRALEPAQIDRYAVLFDMIVAAATRAGRAIADLSCEVLSTMPYPLECMLARYDLGRWRITQKANLDDPRDVYRLDTGRVSRADWVMIGNHDTAPIFALYAQWPAAKRAQWARHLAARLQLDGAARERLDGPGFFASAMVAELLASRAENVSIFFADLFGSVERFNVPGLVDAVNWTLRLPADFDAMHAERLARGAAIDLPLAITLALAAPPG